MDNDSLNNYYYSEEGSLDAHLFHEGTFYRSYEFLGAHPSKDAVRFVVWAPRAEMVYLTGDFNNWHESSLPMKRIKDSGLWEICARNVSEFDTYKYRIVTSLGQIKYKADPYAFHAEERPFTGSKYFDIKGYKWKDSKWIEEQAEKSTYSSPVSIYELNLMSWKRKADNHQHSYRELADDLVRYVKKMGYTHIELMPVMEHPFDGSWGYQITGYFAPTSRFGTPKDFMYLVDKCHASGIGVILDWVPVHFCRDDHGLRLFDGTACFENPDTNRADNEQWGTVNFDFSKPEVMSFMVSNALYWHDYYHIDGIRIDAVAYMLYLNFAGKDLKNENGGYENYDAINFIKKLNTVIFEQYPNTMMIAEESTAWPLVTKPVHDGGLGFNYKWNMGWMNDMLEYMEQDPLFRKGNQNALTFSISYAFSENYVLPLSHDEVVHGKRSLLDKMPGFYEDKFSNLRLLFLYMYAHPGKKLVFMGGEFAQFIEWNEWQELDWHLLEYELHQKMQVFVADLNKLYKSENCFYEQDVNFDGFEWIEHENHQESILTFERINKAGERIICAFNFTPIERKIYPVGVWKEGTYRTLINTSQARFGGTLPRIKTYKTTEESWNGRPYSLRVDIPALGGIILKIKE